MGDWYETDFLSHLHIEKNERVVMILLTERKHAYHKSHACCNIFDKYEVLGLPIHGRYNERGGLTAIKNVADVVNYLKTVNLQYGRMSNTMKVEGRKPEKVKVTQKNLGKLLMDITQEEVYTQDNEIVTRMFINERLYNILIDNYKARTDEYNGHINTYEKLFERKCKRFIKSIPESIEQAKTFGDMPREEQYFYGLAVPNFRDKLEDFRSAWLSDFMKYEDVVKYLLEQMYHNEESYDKNLEYLKELVFFSYVLESMRSGYLVTSGSGGDMREMLLQKLLAEYIITRCEEYVTDWRKESRDKLTDEQILSDEVSDILMLRH